MVNNLVIGPDSNTVTDIDGFYQFPGLPDGTYRVEVTEPFGWNVVVDGSDSVPLVVENGHAIGAADFGLEANGTPYQNPANRIDVNADGQITPLDVLLIVNRLNAGENGVPLPPAQSEPGPPYVDVNGDNTTTPLDALIVINRLNADSAGEGEAPVLAAERAASSLAGAETQGRSLHSEETAGPLVHDLGLLLLLAEDELADRVRFVH